MAPPLENVGREALARVHEQARIQVASQDAGRILWELLPLDRGEDGEPVPLRGFLGLPAPSEGDLFLDLEGDPFALDDGVDYLFGILEPRLRRGRRAMGRRGRRADAEVPRDLEPRRGGPRHLGLGEGGLRGDRGPDHGPLGTRPGPPRLPLRRVRADRARAARAAPRHARGGGRPPAPRRGAGGPVPRRPPGPAGGRRELLHQEDRAALRAHPGAGPEGRREQHRRVRDVAGAGCGHAGRGRGRDPGRHRRLQPGRRAEQLAAPGLAGGAAAGPRGPRGPHAPPPGDRRRGGLAGADGPGAARPGADGAPDRGRTGGSA